MVPFIVFAAALLISSTGVDCGYSSASSGSSSNSDGTGQIYTQTDNNGHGTYHSSGTKPGGGVYHQQGSFPANHIPNNNPNPFPSNNGFGQQPGGLYGQNFNNPNFGGNFGSNYGPSFPYQPFPQSFPGFAPFPAQNFGFQPPLQPLAPPEQFEQYLNSLREHYQTGGSFARSTPGATAFASSYLGPNNVFARQQEFFKQWQNAQAQSQAGNGFGPSGGSNFAYASGSYGPNGFHQTAGVHPPNKDQPNIDDRFNPENNPNGSNFYGISTSSFSSSSDVDGVKKHKEAAVTAINDNGKVTIHKVEN